MDTDHEQPDADNGNGGLPPLTEDASNQRVAEQYIATPKNLGVSAEVIKAA